MTAEYYLRRADGQPFGTFAQAQALIRRVFPSVEFSWTTSGPEMFRRAEASGAIVTLDLRQPLIFIGGEESSIVDANPDKHIALAT